MYDALKIAVERAVRPVGAPAPVKMRMRRELYSLITDIHAEELARGNEPAGAIERTLRRFGPPAELTHELEGSLSRGIRFNNWCNRWLARRGEAKGKTALRIALVMGTHLIVCLGTVLVCSEIFAGQRSLPVLGAAVIVGEMMTAAYILTWLSISCWEFVQKSPQRPAWRETRIWLRALAGGLCVFGIGTLALMVAARGEIPPAGAWRLWGILGAAAVLLMVSVLAAAQTESRGAAEWEELELVDDLRSTAD